MYGIISLNFSVTVIIFMFQGYLKDRINELEETIITRILETCIKE
jgi:hypothetical protein